MVTGMPKAEQLEKMRTEEQSCCYSLQSRSEFFCLYPLYSARMNWNKPVRHPMETHYDSTVDLCTTAELPGFHFGNVSYKAPYFHLTLPM
jgi:hypothetical protein